MGFFDSLKSLFGGIYGQPYNRRGLSTSDSLLKSPIMKVVSRTRWFSTDYSKIYPSPEDYSRNTSLFFNHPYIYAGINVRASYSLGQKYEFVAEGYEPEESNELEEIKKLKKMAIKFDFDFLFFKTAIHLDLYGNCYWYLYKDEDTGEILKIKIIQPERVALKLDKFGNVEKYTIVYPDLSDKTKADITYEVDPEYVVHFVERPFLEIPYGVSILQPIADEAEAKLEMNKLMPVLMKRYAKPFMHFKYKPDQKEENPEDVRIMLEEFSKNLERMEPDSDIVTDDKWDIQAKPPPNVGYMANYIDELDQQVYSVLGIPKFFFKPSGTTDLNVSKADSWFRRIMRDRQIDFEKQFTGKFIIPYLEKMYPDSDVVVMLKFVQDTDEKEAIDKVQKLLNMKVISPEEAREMLGLGPLREEEESMTDGQK